MSLTDLYKPNKFDHFKSNFSQVKEIKSFLKNPSRLLIISGALATGKTTILSIIQEYCKDDTEILVLSNTGNYQKDFVNFTTKSSIENLIFAKKKLVLIDDMHLYEKTFLSSLKTSKVTVIGTCQTKEELKVLDLRKSVKCGAKYLKLNRISIQDCLILISDLIESHDMSDKYECDVIMQTIKECKCNIRKILNSLMFSNNTEILYDTKESPKSTEFTGNVMDMNVYELTSYFMKHKIDDKFISMNITGILSYVIYENFCTLFKMNTREMDSIKIYEEYLTIMIENDDQYYENYDYESKTITDYLLNHKLNRLLLKQNLNTSDNLKFTTVFNKLSIKSAFNKKTNAYCQTKASYCDPLSDMIVGGKEGEDIENLHKKMATDFQISENDSR